MDISAAHAQGLRKQCPRAAIVYDLFHVLTKVGREAIDRLRVDKVNRMRSDRKARQLIKGSKWLLLRNAPNPEKDADRARLHQLAVGSALSAICVYVVKDDRKSL